MNYQLFNRMGSGDIKCLGESHQVLETVIGTGPFPKAKTNTPRLLAMLGEVKRHSAVGPIWRTHFGNHWGFDGKNGFIH